MTSAKEKAWKLNELATQVARSVTELNIGVKRLQKDAKKIKGKGSKVLQRTLEELAEAMALVEEHAKLMDTMSAELDTELQEGSVSSNGAQPSEAQVTSNNANDPHSANGGTDAAPAANDGTPSPTRVDDDNAFAG